jgi:hypothetical protein
MWAPFSVGREEFSGKFFRMTKILLEEFCEPEKSS